MPRPLLRRALMQIRDCACEDHQVCAGSHIRPPLLERAVAERVPHQGAAVMALHRHMAILPLVAKRQGDVMTDAGLIEIDHLLAAVPDAEAAGAAFERLGFTVTPRSVIGSMGLANRLVLLDPLTEGTANFIELMSLHGPGPANPAMRELLDGPAAIRSMVMASFDAEATRAGLEAQGHVPGPVHKVEREWVLPSGERLDVAFDVLLPMRAPFAFNVCRYRTLQHYLRPEWRVHRNGARSLVAVHAVADDPAGAAAFYARLFGRRAERRDDGSFAVGPGAVRLTISTPEGFIGEFGFAPPAAGGFAGCTIAVAELGRAKALLARHGVETAGGGGPALLVPPHEAQGNLIRFVGPL